VRPFTNILALRGRYCTRCHVPFQCCQLQKWF